MIIIRNNDFWACSERHTDQSDQVALILYAVLISTWLISPDGWAQGYYVDEQSAKRLGDAFSGGAAASAVGSQHRRWDQASAVGSSIGGGVKHRRWGQASAVGSSIGGGVKHHIYGEEIKVSSNMK